MLVIVDDRCWWTGDGSRRLHGDWASDWDLVATPGCRSHSRCRVQDLHCTVRSAQVVPHGVSLCFRKLLKLMNILFLVQVAGFIFKMWQIRNMSLWIFRTSIQTRWQELFQPTSIHAFELQYDFVHVRTFTYILSWVLTKWYLQFWSYEYRRYSEF